MKDTAYQRHHQGRKRGGPSGPNNDPLNGRTGGVSRRAPRAETPPRRRGAADHPGTAAIDAGLEVADDYRLVHTPELLRILGISRTGLYLWRKAGIFPEARRFGRHSIGWLWSDIKSFLRSRPTADHRGVDPD